MNVVGHEDIPNKSEPVASANFVQRLGSPISGANRTEQGPALIAAERDEMQIAAAVEALQSFGHKREEGPTLCKNRV